MQSFDIPRLVSVYPDKSGIRWWTKAWFNNRWKTFKESLCKALDIKEDTAALDVESEDVGNDKKIQHDVDYTTSVDEQGNVAMEVETSDQEERRHYHR